MNLEQFIGRVAELGLDGFQIDPMHLACADPGYLREIKALAEERQLFLEYGGMSLEPSRLMADLQICSALGSTILRTFAGFNRYARKTVLADEMRRAVDQLRQIKPAAAERGIQIAVENHGDFSAAELVQIMQAVDSPWIGICLDLGNSMATFEDPVTAAQRMAPFAKTTHFKDHGVTLTYHGFIVYGTALGEGVIDLPAALQVLKTNTSLDRIILEIPSEAQADEEQSIAEEDDKIRRSIAYARNTLQIC